MHHNAGVHSQLHGHNLHLLESVFADLEDSDSELVKYLDQVSIHIILKELSKPQRKVFLLLCDKDMMTESAEIYAKTHITDYESKVLIAITTAIDELVTK